MCKFDCLALEQEVEDTKYKSTTSKIYYIICNYNIVIYDIVYIGSGGFIFCIYV